MKKKICSRVIARFNRNRKRTVKLCIRNKHDSLQLLPAECSHGLTNHSSAQLNSWTREIQTSKKINALWTERGWGMLSLLHLWIVRQTPPGPIVYENTLSASPTLPRHTSRDMCLSLSTTPEVADAKIDIANSPISYSDDAEGTQSSIFWPEHPNQVPLDLDYKDDYYDSSQNADYSDFFRPSLMSESPQLNLETEGSYPFNDDDDYDYSDDGVTEVNIASILRTPISSLPTVASFELRWRLRYNPAARNIKPWQRAFPDLFDVRLDEENLLTYNAERIDQWRKDNSSYFIACTVMYFSEALMHIQVVVPKVKQDSTTIEITLHNRSDRELLFNCSEFDYSSNTKTKNSCGLCAQHDVL